MSDQYGNDQWHYAVAPISLQDDVPFELDKWGQDGWELVTLTQDDKFGLLTCYFKKRGRMADRSFRAFITEELSD